MEPGGGREEVEMGRHGGLRSAIIILTTLLILGAPVVVGAIGLVLAPRCPGALVAYTGSGLPADAGGQRGVGIRLRLGIPRADGGGGMRVEYWRPAHEGERVALAGRGGRSLAARVRRIVIVGRAAHSAVSTLLHCVLGGTGESAHPEF